jgi:hypothetical protein
MALSGCLAPNRAIIHAIRRTKLQEVSLRPNVFSIFCKSKLISHGACTTSYKNMQWYIQLRLTVPRTTHLFEGSGVDKSQNPCVGIFLAEYPAAISDARSARVRSPIRRRCCRPIERPGCVYGAREQAGRRRRVKPRELSRRRSRCSSAWVRAARRLGKAKCAGAARARRCAPCLTYAADATENVATSAHPASRKHAPTVTRGHGEKPRRRAGADLHSSRGLRDREEDQNL